MVKVITNLTEIPQDKKVVIDFYATWCGPCKDISPKFITLSTQYTDIVFLKVDVDNNESELITKKYKIQSLPTFVFLNNDIIIDTAVGSSKLYDKLDKLHKI